MGRRRNKAEYIIEARRRIRDLFDGLPIFQRTRGQALYHYCAVLEVEAFKAFKAGDDATVLYQPHREAVESSIRAIPALSERCPADSTEQVSIDRQIFSEALQLFDYSRKYEQVEFSFELAAKGQFEIHVAEREPRITFAYARKEWDAAETLLRSGELWERIGHQQQQGKHESTVPVIGAVRTCLQQGIRFVREDSIAYEYTPDLISHIADWANQLSTLMSWEFPADLAFGSLTFGDLRRFWGALLAVSDTHEMAHLIAMRGNEAKWPIGTIVNLRSAEEWICVLSDVSGLNPQVTSEVLSWYRFDPRVAAKTPPLQPFLAITPERLCAPHLFLVCQDVERNFLKLLNLHPQLMQYVDTVKAKKEPLALAQLSALFPEPAFKTATRVCIPGTDVDLVIYECESAFALLIQHKWLIAPETASESSTNDAELRKGVHQALKARDHLREKSAQLRQALSLSSSSPLSSIEAMVVCRGAEGTGFSGSHPVPIMTEKAFRSFVDRKQQLTQLWKWANARPDLADASGRFWDGASTIKLGAYKFVIPALAWELPESPGNAPLAGAAAT